MAEPDDHFARAVEAQRAGDFAGAVEIYLQIAKARLTANVATNLGVCLIELGRLEDAEHWFGVVARNRPGDSAARLRLGNAYLGLGKLDLAELEYRTALALQPDNAFATLALGGYLLSVGRFAEGWPLLEVRAELNPDTVPPISVSFPQWRGESLAGKSILVWYEQGLGDQIQMSRFAQTLKARGAATVTLGCRPPLTDLLATVPGVDHIVRVGMKETVAVQAHDYWSRYFSLPHHLGVTLETLPSAPYISAPPDRRGRWPGFEGRVGLTWQASPTGFNGANKSLGQQDAQALLDLGCVSLHPEDTGVADFADTAAIVEQLDLVISIDTSVAHLAGAMGKPCWTLLPYLRTDWRWLHGRADSPWYPTMRLYRQAAAGDWRPVIKAVTEDLARWRAR